MDKYWQISGYGGQHDEAGATIVTEDGFRVCQTLDIWEAARILGVHSHDSAAWKLYHDIPKGIVEYHNFRVHLRENTS